MTDDILKLEYRPGIIDEEDKKPQHVVDTKKNHHWVTVSTLGVVKNYNSSYVANKFINDFELFHDVAYLNGDLSEYKKYNINGFENFVFNKIAEVKLKRLVAKKKKNISIFKDVVSEIIRIESIKKSAFDLFVKYNEMSDFYLTFVNFLQGDDVVDNKKLRYSIINLISKSVEINEVKGVGISFSIDEISNSIILNLVKRPLARDYMVNLNLKFKPNGSVSFMCYDSDDSDKSYITGSVSRYDTYMSSIKFKAIIDMLESGA